MKFTIYIHTNSIHLFYKGIFVLFSATANPADGYLAIEISDPKLVKFIDAAAPGAVYTIPKVALA